MHFYFKNDDLVVFNTVLANSCFHDVHREIVLHVYTLYMFLGKGPLRSHYEAIIKKKKMNFVQIVTVWLQAEDYPLLLC